MKYVKKVIHFCKMIPVGLLLVLTILSAGLSILEVSTDILKRVPQGAIYGIYIMAAISLSLTICRLIGLFRNPEWKSKLWEALHRWKLLGKLVDDFSYRTIVATRLSFVINMIFAISKGAAGWLSASAWLIVRRQITIGCNSKLNFRLTSIRPRGLTGNCTFLSD